MPRCSAVSVPVEPSESLGKMHRRVLEYIPIGVRVIARLVTGNRRQPLHRVVTKGPG